MVSFLMHLPEFVPYSFTYSYTAVADLHALFLMTFSVIRDAGKIIGVVSNGKAKAKSKMLA